MIFCSVQDAVNLLTLFKYLLSSIVSLLSRTSIDGSIFFTCTTCIVYQYFKELAAFVLKAGAKVKALFLTTKLFRKFFFIFFLFTHFSGSLCERERMYKRKTKAVFFANRTAKIRTLFIILQNFSEVFFVLFFKRNFAFSLCQFCKAFFSWKAGAKVHPFSIQSKYIKLFFRSFFERIC